MTSEITTNENPEPAVPGRITQISFVVLTFVTYFTGLTIPFVGPDEPRYAQVAREMLERGDWVTPTLGGSLWFEKPALFYWLEMIGFTLFGVNEFAARFGAALCGLGTVASLWILGRVVEKDYAVIKGFSFYLFMISASTIGIMVFSRGASFDIVITFPITGALASFFIYDLNHKKVRENRGFPLPLVLFYFFIGIALLAKGLIGIVFPFTIVAFYYAFDRRVPGRVFFASLLWGTCLASAVASIWYVPMVMKHGYRFIDEFIIQHHFQRFTSNKYQHPQPFYFFLWVLPLMTLPWLPFFLASIGRAILRILRKNIDSNVNERELLSLLKFSFIWMFVIVLFFSVSGSKLPGYILPALPGAIILTVLYAFQFAGKARLRHTAIKSGAFGFLLFSIILVVFVVPKYADADSVKNLIIAADARGYGNQTVYSLHTISHNAEFYAAGRLLRSEDGKQRKLYGPTEVADEMHKSNTTQGLVLIPIEYLKQITNSELFHSEWIRDNGELAIVEVTLK